MKHRVYRTSHTKLINVQPFVMVFVDVLAGNVYSSV